MIDPLPDGFWSGLRQFERTLLDGNAHVPVPTGREGGQVLSFPYSLNLTNEIVPDDWHLPVDQGLSECLGVRIEVVPSDLVLLPLARVVLGGGLYVNFIS